MATINTITAYCCAVHHFFAAMRMGFAKHAGVGAIFITTLISPCVADETAHVVELPVGISPSLVIDALIETGWNRDGVKPSNVCDDETFVRRVTLDLIGRIPTSEERDRFLSDTRSDKRSRWVDDLLSSDAYATHMADLFDGMLLGRRGSSAQARRRQHGWRAYLEASFRENRSWDKMARDMVLARDTDVTDVRGGWFLYERRDNAQAMAEAVAPNFFGLRIDCAQCHDHPLASEIQQGHYWGLVAFFSRSKNQNTQAGPRVVEDAVGGFLKFSDLAGDNYDAELTFFEGATVPEQRPKEEKKEATDDDFRSDEDRGKEPRVPKFSRREEFVDEILMKHPLLARAFVNRMWGLMSGRGFVHPFNEMDSMHTASHPELLTWLSDDFRRSGYDIKRLVRAIALSRCYQLESKPADEDALPEHFAFGLTKPLNAESLLRSMMTAIEGSAEVEFDDEMVGSFRAAFPDILAEVPSAPVGQALMLSNEAKFNQLAMRDDSPLRILLADSPDAQARVKTAFKVIFGRSPTAEEQETAADYLVRNENTNEATANLIWAMLTSAEFRVNH